MNVKHRCKDPEKCDVCQAAIAAKVAGRLARARKAERPCAACEGTGGRDRGAGRRCSECRGTGKSYT